MHARLLRSLFFLPIQRRKRSAEDDGQDEIVYMKVAKVASSKIDDCESPPPPPPPPPRSPPPPPPVRPPPPTTHRSEDKIAAGGDDKKPSEGVLSQKKSDLERVVQKLQKGIEFRRQTPELLEEKNDQQKKDTKENEEEDVKRVGDDEGESEAEVDVVDDSCIRTDLSRLLPYIGKRKRIDQASPIKASTASEMPKTTLANIPKSQVEEASPAKTTATPQFPTDRLAYEYAALYNSALLRSQSQSQWPRYATDYEYAASLLHHYHHLSSIHPAAASFVSPLTSPFWSQPCCSLASNNLMAGAANFYSRLQNVELNKSTVPSSS